jgi:hypothetical protein
MRSFFIIGTALISGSFIFLSHYLVAKTNPPTRPAPAKVSSIQPDELSKTEERTFDFRSGGTVQVTADAGFIRVESWDKNEVFLRYTKRVWENRHREAERRLEELKVEITDHPDQLIIRQVSDFEPRHRDFFDLLDPDRWGRWYYEPRIDFELRVPRQCNLVLETDEGDITVHQVEGGLDANSDEGNVNLEDLAGGDVSAETDEGELEFRNLQLGDSRLTVVSDEGSIRIIDIVTHTIEAETDEGDMIFLRAAARGGKLTTDEGDIELDAVRFDDGAWHFTTDEGDVELFLPANADTEIDLQTTDGSIRSDFALNRVSDGEGNGERRTGRLGEGRGRLEVYTDEGDISLRRR